MKITRIYVATALSIGLIGCGSKLPDCSDPAITKLASELVEKSAVAQAQQSANRFLAADIDQSIRSVYTAMGAKAIFDISGIKVQLTTPRMVDVKKEVGIVTCEANVSADAGRFIFGFDLSSVKDPNEKSADQKAKEAASGKSTMDELAKLEGSSPIAAPPPENEKKDRLDVSTLAPLYSQMHAMRFKDGLSYAADIGKQTITMTAPATVPAAVFRYSAQFVDKGDKVLVQAVQQ